MQRVNFLDFLRGGAALMVLVGHMFVLVPNSILAEYTNFLGRGVQLFYLISGYTLYMIYKTKIITLKDIGKFILKRFFRIAPLFYILIVVYYYCLGLNLSSYSTNKVGDFVHILLHYSFLFGFLPETMVSIIPPAWSIFVEVVCYILFAFVVYRFKSYLFYIVIITFAIHIFSIFISNIFYKNDVAVKEYIFFTPLYQMFVFFIGCLIYEYKDMFKKTNLFLYLGILFGCFMPFIKYNFLNVWVAVLCFSCFLIYFSSNCNIKFPKFILFIGQISYSIYLIHMLIIEFFVKYFLDLNIFIVLILCLLSVFIISWLTYFFIEKKMLLMGNIILSKYFR